ncbi:Protein bark beetle [Nymphon striatum]|nr:Protein bark beetle [Nymphon striatum]
MSHCSSDPHNDHQKRLSIGHWQPPVSKNKTDDKGTPNRKITFTSEKPGSWRGIPKNIRLVEGSSVLNGRLQLFYKGSWRAVCTNSKNWTQTDLNTACKQLGFRNGRFLQWYDRVNNDTKQLLYQSPNCTVGAGDVTQCEWSSRQLGGGVCNDHLDLGIECDPHVDSNGQYWAGINFVNAEVREEYYLLNSLKRKESQSIIENAQILYAGINTDGEYTSAVQSHGVPPRLENVEIKWSAFNGLNISSPLDGFQIKGCKIIQNRGYGVYVNTSQGMAEITDNTIISDNGGDGIRYVFHNLFESARDSFCEFSSRRGNQIYPKRLIHFNTRDKRQTQPCTQEFTSKGLPGQVLTVHFLSIRSDENSQASLEVYDDIYKTNTLLTRFVLRNDSRPASVASTGRSIRIKFIPDLYKEVYFTIEVTTGIGKATDLNITDSVIKGNNGRGIVVENERSSIVVNRSQILENTHIAGLHVLGGAGDIYVNNSIISRNIGDGINITYTGGIRMISKTKFTNNIGHAVAVWLNESSGIIYNEQRTEISYSDFSLNHKIAIVFGNFCKSDVFVNVSMNHFSESMENVIQLTSCWKILPSGVLPTNVQITHNKFTKNKKLAIEFAPALNLDALIEHNEFTKHENGVIYIESDFDDYDLIPTLILIQYNRFYENSGTFVCKIGLVEGSIVQKILFTKNMLRDNEILEPFPHLRSRNRIAAVVAVSSVNTEVYRNMFKNPLSSYELGSHLEGHYLKINATFNYWGKKDDAKFIYNRIFDVKNRYNLAKVEFLQFLKVETDVETTYVSDILEEQNIIKFREDQVIGGAVMGEVRLEAGEFDVKSDIYVQSGSNLILNPGTVLKFSQSVGMMVQGYLLSEGSPENKIRYTSGFIENEIPSDLPVKLTSESEGRLMVKLGERWGTVCRYGWSIEDAALVCNQLGLVLNPNDWILEKIDVYNVTVVGESSGILLNNVQCSKFDTDITKCKAETIENFENSCDEEVSMRCYKPSWAGVHFGMMADRSTVKNSIVEKAGLYDYSTNTFRPALQADFNHHIFQELTLTENFDSGLGIMYNDLFYDRNQPEIKDSILSSNKFHGAVTRTQGFGVINCTIADNRGSGIRYHSKISNHEHKDLMKWINLNDRKKIINITNQLEDEIVTINEGDKKFVIIRPDGKYDKSDQEIRVKFETSVRNVLGIQILKPIHKHSTESVIIYDYHEVNQNKINWDLRKNLTVFPRVSTSYTITLVYKPGSLPYGSIVFSIASVSRNDFDVNFIPKLLIQSNNIVQCGVGISTVHYNRDISESGDLYMRNANESILILNTILNNNGGPALYVNTPSLDPVQTTLAEINITISEVKARENKGIIIQNSRDSRNSNNLFHWKVNQSVFENNDDKGIKINLPYVWSYNENYTHTVNFTKNMFGSNNDFGLSITGHFARLHLLKNLFKHNKCSRGLIDIGGMEKEIMIMSNEMLQNRGRYMMRFNIHSHSSKFGTVPADFVYNTLRANSYYSPRDDYDNQGYYPSSYTLGLFGVQRINITSNLFAGNTLQFELLAGIRTGTIQNEINVTNNWWGTSDEVEIQKKIFDFDDWNSYAIANFIPFLTSESFDAPTFDTDIKEQDIDLSKPLGGKLYKSLVLEKQSEPYIVKTDLTVMPGATLTIDPGVEIQFYPSSGILVLGELVSIGKSDDRIQLKPLIRKDYGLRYARETDKPKVRLCVNQKCDESRRDGFLEIFNSTTLHWIPICDSRFTEWNAQVVCHELGYSTQNVFFGRDKRNDLSFNTYRLNSIKYWPEPLQCEGDEAKFADCDLRMNGYHNHDHNCQVRSNFVYIHCGDINIKDVEYWGGIRFSVPNFEQKQINIRHQFQSDKHPISALEYTDIVGAGILHGYKTAAIQTSLTTAHINHVSISQSASHGISLIAAIGEIDMYKNHIYNNLGVGLNVLLLYGASVTGDNLMYTPVQTVSIPHHVFGMVDICDANKELIVDGRVLLYYKYTNSPVDCVKIFSSKFGTKPLGFRLLQFNLVDSTNWSTMQDVIRLYDGDIFNNTIPIIEELWALKENEKEADDHDADHHDRFEKHDNPKYHQMFYRSTEGTLSVALHASGGSGINGFIAEVITLDNSHSIGHGLTHNFTKCNFEKNDEGAVKYANAGEGIAKVAFHLNKFENNGKQLYGNFTSSNSAMRIEVQNTPDILIFNNAFRKNQGGLFMTSFGATWRSSLNGYISNNLFLENENREALLIKGTKSGSSNQKINVALNTFAYNKAPYRDTIVFSQVVSNFTMNLVMNNTGRHIMDVHWFYSLSSQTVISNWFQNNIALMPRSRGTIVASTGGQIFKYNYLVNPENDFELISLNRSKYWRPGEKEEAVHATHNWWGYNETIAIIGRIKDQYDNKELLLVKHKNFFMNNKTVLSDNGKCGPGYTIVGKTCILFIGGILPFKDAKEFCERSDGALPFIRGNEDLLSQYVAKKQQYDYERYLKVWVQSVDVPIGSCPILLDGEVHQNDCDELLPFLCEKDPDIVVSFDLWYKDIMTVIALSVVLCALLLMIPCIIFWVCKSRRRHKQTLERRNSIRASIRSNRNAMGFGELGYKRRFDVNQLPSARPTAFKLSNSFTNGSIDSIEKSPSRFNSSVEDNRSYEIYEAHNSQISYPKYDDKYSDNNSEHPPPIEDKFRNDPQLEEENIKMTVNPTFDYAIPNKGFLDNSYSQPSHDSSHDWGSTDSTFDTKQSIDFSQMLNGYNGYHDSATLPRNTPSAESGLSHETSKSQPLETAM